MTHHQPNATQYFPHERLIAYQLARSAVQFVASRRDKLSGLPGNASQQLHRAIVGAHTNVCGGAAARGAEARRLFRIALSEAGEAGGCIDIALDYGALAAAEHEQLRQILLRLCACLAGLTRG